MILFLFTLLAAQAIAGPAEDTVDKILTAFMNLNGGKSVDMPVFTYPYQLTLGVFITTIDIGFSNGDLTLDSFSRLGAVDGTEDLAFTADIYAKLAYTYDFRSSVPAYFASGNANIDWIAPVSMKLTASGNKASLESISLLQNGTLALEALPFTAGRSATLYPRGNSKLAAALFSAMQSYLSKTFKDISY